MGTFHLGELISIAEIERRGKRNIPLMSISKSDGIVPQTKDTVKGKISGNPENYKVINPGQLVIGIHLNEGTVFVFEGYEIGAVSPAYSIWNIDTKIIVPKYLEFCLHSKYCMDFFSNTYQMTTSRRGKVPPELFSKLKINVPDISKQLAAIRVFEKLNSIKKLLKLENERIRDLNNTAFNEMKSDKIIPLPETCNFSAGQAPKSGQVTKNNEGPAFCQGKSDFGTFFPNTTVFCKNAPSIAEPGDIFISISNNKREANIVDRKCGFGRNIGKITPNKEPYNTAFVFTALNFTKLSNCPGFGIQRTLNKNEFSRILVPDMCKTNTARFEQVFQKIIEIWKKRESIKNKVDILESSCFNQYFNIGSGNE